jgi:cholesterol oxidase
VASRHFDAIIVGSGFGGSVAADKLAEAGLRICVLEHLNRVVTVYPLGDCPMGRHKS